MHFCIWTDWLRENFHNGGTCTFKLIHVHVYNINTSLHNFIRTYYIVVTMQGPSDNPGINQRALLELFSLVEERQSDYDYSIVVSVLEIYNECVRDLLAVDPTVKLDIKQSPEGVYVPGLTQVAVSQLEEVNEVYTHVHFRTMLILCVCMGWGGGDRPGSNTYMYMYCIVQQMWIWVYFTSLFISDLKNVCIIVLANVIHLPIYM